jgi:hypothetical protein
MKDERVTKIVVSIIKQNHPGLWQFARANSFKDDAGNRIFVHDDSIVWETCEWVDYLVLDQINDQIESQGIPVIAEYLNSYEIQLESV